jgi:hypothetical protein
MATRMQQRRGTAAQWTAANPVLAAGEIGFETDTSKFKMGNGSSTWSALTYFANAAELAAIIDGAPAALNTLNELAEAMGDNPAFLTTIATNLSTHAADTTDVHGIPDTSVLVTVSDLEDALGNTTAAYVDLAGTGIDWNAQAERFDIDSTIATVSSVTSQVNLVGTNAAGALVVAKAEIADNLANHASDTTGIHGIADTALLATKSYADTAEADAITAAGTAASSALNDHNVDTTNVHGIADTSVLVVQSGLASAISLHSDDTTNVHGIADTSLLATTAATTSAIGTAVSNHNSVTTNVHGISDTAALATKTYADGAVTTAVSALTKSSVGLANVDNTSDANKPVSTATQTALDLKAPLANPTFTGTVSGITKSMVGLANVSNTADADKPVSTATQTALNAKLNLAGGTLTGALTLSGAPTSDLHAATKQYVDGLAAGINFHQPVVAASTGNLAGVYDNGTNGVGATLTASANGAIGTIDGASVSVGNRILLRAQTDATQNGIYTITNVGGASAKWVVTRAVDADNNPSGELATGDFVFVTSGSTNGSKGYILSTTGTITIGTTNVNYAQFNASEAVTAGTNITKSGSTIAVADAPTFSGAVTASSGIVFSDGTQTKAGVPSITTIPTAIAAGAHSLATGRADQLIPLTGAVVITLPASGYSTGQSIDFYQESGTGARFEATNGVVGTPGRNFRTTNSVVTAMKTSAGWLVFGDLSA